MPQRYTHRSAPKVANVIQDVELESIPIDEDAYEGIDFERELDGREPECDSIPIVLARRTADRSWAACSGAHWLTHWKRKSVDVMPVFLSTETARMLAALSTRASTGARCECKAVFDASKAIEADCASRYGGKPVPSSFMLGCAMDVSWRLARYYILAGEILSPKLQGMFDTGRFGFRQLDEFSSLTEGQLHTLMLEGERIDMESWKGADVKKWIGDFRARPWNEADEQAGIACAALRRLDELSERGVKASTYMSEELMGLAKPFSVKRRRD